MINLINCLSKVVEKLVVKQLSQFCEKSGKLHKERIEVRKRQSAMDTTAIFIQQVHKIWVNKTIAGVLLIDNKEAFNHVSQAKLAKWNFRPRD